MRCEFNARQGVSIVGGVNYSFADCKFNHTGKAGFYSSPGGGVDIEAEGEKIVRNLAFTSCEFSDNSGPGLVADQGDGSGATFTKCTFIGTTNWAAWPNKPNFAFDACRFVGPIVNAFGDLKDATRATQFRDCEFLDDPKLSPTGKVFIGQNTEGPIADLSNNPNVKFMRCNFKLTDKMVLPWTVNSTIFEDCTMSQVSTTISYPRGTFLGTNTITGKADLYSYINKGVLILNGNVVPPN